jgi:hypothetical protein
MPDEGATTGTTHDARLHASERAAANSCAPALGRRPALSRAGSRFPLAHDDSEVHPDGPRRPGEDCRIHRRTRRSGDVRRERWSSSRGEAAGTVDSGVVPVYGSHTWVRSIPLRSAVSRGTSANVARESERRLDAVPLIVHSGSHAASRPGARSPTKAPRCCACSPAQMRRSASAFGLHRRRPRAPEFMPKRNSGRSAMTAGALTTRRFSRLAKPRDAPAVVSRRRLPSYEREARQRVAAMLPPFVLPKHNALVSVTSAGSVAGRRAAGTRERIASR